MVILTDFLADLVNTPNVDTETTLNLLTKRKLFKLFVVKNVKINRQEVK